MASSQGDMNYVIIILLLIYEISAQLTLEELKLHDEVLLARSRRQLLFPNSTLLQLNMGVGTPTPMKTIMVNWAFQANFQLPWNTTQIPLDIMHANGGYQGMSRRQMRDIVETERENHEGNYNSDAKLYHFYKYIEDVLNSYSHNGTACVLLTLCQVGAEPLHSDDKEDLLHELASFVLNPNNDVEAHHSEIPGDQETQTYIDAYNHGRNNKNCSSIYKNCSITIIDLFSKIYENDIED